MSDHGSAKAYNDRNVYILGAGFSADAGLPLIKDFMNRMRDAAAWLEKQGGRQAEVAAIESVLEFRLKAAAAAYRVPLDVENIEELFSLASASGSAELSDQVTLAIAATLDFCDSTGRAMDQNRVSVTKVDGAELDRPPPLNWKSIQHQEYPSGKPGVTVYECPAYEFFLGLMCGYLNDVGPNRRDTIISLNYDMVVEDALSALRLPFCYGGDEMIDWQASRPAANLDCRPIPVLKLHGSLNIAQRSPAGAKPELRAYNSHRDLRREGLVPMLVAPTWQKSLSGYLSAVWREAVSSLRTATRVVIMGYSVPQTDQHFRYLLGAGLQENISLRRVLSVNEDASEEFKGRLTALFRKEHFERGIVTIIPYTVKHFFMDEACRQLVFCYINK